MPGYLLALDLGSTQVRALVVADDGRVLARESVPLGTRFPAPGYVEQDPAEMWSASLRVLRGALVRAGLHAREIAGLGLVSQRGTAIAWDARTLQPLAPALSWQDRRTAPRCAELAARGIPIEPLAAASKLEWLVTRSDAVRRCADAGSLRLGTPDVWLAACLSAGEAAVTDPGNAGATALYDPRLDGFSPRALELFSLDAAWLPEVVPTAAVCGATPAALLGAPVALAARAGDQQAATFAQGAHAEGDAKLTLGTSAMLDVHTGGRMRPPPPGTYPLPLWRLATEPLVFCLEGAVVTAGAAVEWLVAIGVLDEAASLDRVAGEVASSDGVFFVPALEGLGTPHMDPAARGLVLGLTRGTTRAHLARALVDGLAHRCADLCEVMPLREGPLRVDGGLAHSRLLLAGLADVLGREVHRAAETETTALGAALFAALATGVLDSADRGRAVGRPPEVFAPTSDAAFRERSRAEWRRAVARALGRADAPSAA